MPFGKGYRSKKVVRKSCARGVIAISATNRRGVRSDFAKGSFKTKVSARRFIKKGGFKKSGLRNPRVKVIK